ncbi:hypothetical protein KZ483_00495 [Paenibacillus sp. sptzw28]|jgi:hypothetical protein|uniref:DUF7667 family protein n=1 Tax=Paenibacillus sp. sptzw28 TaxID=715179 RepID=UPI001C6F0559|nr:hypothetical protein [Paenibacillus sp. sptzw28]QYR21580.1 hypothetical protein KZ483_00495 [Paenibacillus sp. sptzw28]
MGIFPIHERLAELWVIKGRRGLSGEEEADFEHCLAVNAAYCRQLANLYNMSLLASMTADTEWQYDICRKIEKLDGPPPASPRL